MDTAQGKAAVIWMLGEFGHLIDDAPYILEPLIDGLSSESESESVRCELLAATVKLFFKRPPGAWPAAARARAGGRPRPPTRGPGATAPALLLTLAPPPPPLPPPLQRCNA